MNIGVGACVMRAMSLALQVRGVSKTYHRRWRGKSVQALSDVDLDVEAGSIFGLLGPNGAGKTTLVKVALTIAHPDSGTVHLLGRSIGDRGVFGRVGYLPENPRFPSHLTARQILRFYGSLSGMSGERLEKAIATWLERVGLAQWGETRVGKFSKGMNERLGFAQAVLHSPDVIFLDEPTDGLDPVGRREVRSICKELAREGRTIFINSHILAEIELICDRLALMKGGRIVDSGTVQEMTRGRGEYEVLVPTGDRPAAWLAEHGVPFQAVDGHLHIHASDRAGANALIDRLRSEQFEIESVRAKRKTLEAVVIEKMEEQ